MAANKTLTMIKPDAVRNGHIGAILNKLRSRFSNLSYEVDSTFTSGRRSIYCTQGTSILWRIVEFMTSGPIVAAIFKKDNAIEDFRILIGSTNPAEAAEGTIRVFCN